MGHWEDTRRGQLKTEVSWKNREGWQAWLYLTSDSIQQQAQIHHYTDED